MSGSKSQLESQDSAASDRLDSWKEIAVYLGREVRTVRRWEKAEGLPVHRHFHGEAATVYAYEAELDEWIKGRAERKNQGDTAPVSSTSKRLPITYSVAIAILVALIVPAYLFGLRPALAGSGSSAAGALIEDGSSAANHDPVFNVLFAEVPASSSARQASFDISPSGDRGVFYEVRDGEPGQLYVYEQSGSVIRPLLDDLGSWDGFRQPKWSPSGHLIAYRANRPAKPGAESVAGEPNPVHAIFVVSPDGGTPRQIGSTLPNIGGLCWTPDGQGITYLSRPNRGIHTVALDGSGVTTVQAEMSGPTYLGGYSPDGRWLALKVRADFDEPGPHSIIRLISTTGGQSVDLTTYPGGQASLTWAPDGKSLYFGSNESGEPNIWNIEIDPETGQRKGDPVQKTFFLRTVPFNFKFIDDGQGIAFSLLNNDQTVHVSDASSPMESRSVANGSQPMLSLDGQVYFSRNYGANDNGIFSVPTDGGTPSRITDDAPFDLSPDGTTLAYIQHEGADAALLTVSTRGGEPRLLVEYEVMSDPVPKWSPDGSLLAYTHGDGLYVIPANGGSPKKLAELYSWEAWTLRWSPDGKYIAALASKDAESGNEVFVVPASGGELRRLTTDKLYLEGLEWHPDGKRLTYHISVGKSETRQVSLDGGSSSLLVNDPDGWDYLGKWAPDGRRYYFSIYVEGRWNVQVFDEATGDISLFADYADLPAWSRDGKRMAWVSYKETGQIWVMSNFR